MLIDNKGIKDILHHKPYNFKGALANAIIPTINNGLVINGEINHKKRNYNTVILAAKLNFTNDFDEYHKSGDYYVAVALKRTRNDRGNINQKLHVVDAEIVPTKKSLTIRRELLKIVTHKSKKRLLI